MAAGKFVTAVNCMDGRVQEPVIAWMKKRFKADVVDMITEPGPDRVMTASPLWGLQSVRSRVEISVNAHHSDAVAVVAHHDCAGHPVSKEQHISALRKCVDLITSWHLPVRVLALWVNDRWQVEVVHDTSAID